jgi:hypothetical protein
MPKIELTEQCGRCPRVERSSVSLEEAVERVKSGAPKHKAFTAALDGKEVLAFEHLCEECRGILAGYCEGMKPQGKKSARRFKRVVVEGTERALPAKKARAH